MNRYIWKITHGNKIYKCDDIKVERIRSILNNETRIQLIDLLGWQGVETLTIRFRPNDPITIERVTAEQDAPK